ncbi:related to acyl-coenzyme A:6-aminopenicillanic-acid-acyltransferase precursor [Phialocephala subalpina]|uniref:Related to acyl-coenzyme A:6-aminopenicillanic-acid-acyltransferase n=1 Tax=Phialocephala subalpina TaxID=576137 RepID=A0A1L7XHE8_9HELO|nr:related to acyl-coenzyme A:6-aminopenicillanic-acid-acyltransferase precursor [Phialocephala subalpina]
MAVNSSITMDHPFVKTVYCTGSPYNIGFTHGSCVSAEVHSNVATYTFFFNETAQITWQQARERAVAQFFPTLERSYPEILEEMKGIAEGAGGGLTRDDILTLNVRSEISLTNHADGCTSISQSTEEGEIFLAQNWDWLEELRNGMVLLHIKPTESDIDFKFLSEAGLVGKIGMNSAGFGFCMNAIRSGAFNSANFPVHIMSRRLLQYDTSFDSAIAILDQFGVASAINYMLGDKSGNHADIECSPYGNSLILPHDGFVAHTNHLYGPHRRSNLVDHPAANSFSRLSRIQLLTEIDKRMEVPTTFESLRSRLSDELGTPFSICRDRPPGAVGMERMTTLSTIMMKLKSGKGVVLIGRPCDELPIVKWSF